MLNFMRVYHCGRDKIKAIERWSEDLIKKQLKSQQKEIRYFYSQGDHSIDCSKKTY